MRLGDCFNAAVGGATRDSVQVSPSVSRSVGSSIPPFPDIPSFSDSPRRSRRLCENKEDGRAALLAFDPPIPFLLQHACLDVEQGLPVGVDDADNAVWLQWAAPRIDSFSTPGAWFQFDLPTGLSNAFPGFHTKNNEPVWEEPIKIALHWYLAANAQEGAIEGATILAQNGLELLSWVHLVEDTGTFSRTQFKNRPAKENIKEMLRMRSVAFGLASCAVMLLLHRVRVRMSRQ